MSLARYFVMPVGDEWIVTLDGATIGRHASRQAALNSAIIMADLMGSMQHDADVMIQGEGRLDLAWTYGTDELPGQTGGAA